VGLDVGVGLVLAEVQDSRPTPYRVRIEVRTLDETEWERAVDMMATRASYAAQLLNGEMPRDIEDLLRGCDVSLFPASRSEVSANCTCSDPVNPCKHAAAVYLTLGRLLDQDPFVLFHLRGRTREQIVQTLRERRTARGAVPLASGETRRLPQPASLANDDASGTLKGFWRLGGELDALTLHVQAPEVEHELLKVLGEPTFAEDDSLREELAAVYGVVSRKALQVAFSEWSTEEEGPGD
jgi:uncharacterized Zn finger protein